MENINEINKEVNKRRKNNSRPKQIGCVVGCKKLNVRKRPSMDSEVMTIILEKDSVKIVSTDNPAFYEVITNDKKHGYCKKEYISISGTIDEAKEQTVKGE